MSNKHLSHETSFITNWQSDHYRTRLSPRHRVAIAFTGPGRTKQGFGAECNINTIMARYMATGVLEHASDPTDARYQDVSGWDYHEAMNTVAAAQSAFASLPAKLRDRFDNDPAILMDFVHDPANRVESIAMGFLSEDALPEGWGLPEPAPSPQPNAGPIPTTSPTSPAPQASLAKS